MSTKKKVISGVKWTSTASAVNVCVHLVQLIILTNLLNPKDFGLMAIVVVVIGFSEMFIDMGVSNAIIYKEKVSLTQLTSLYWLNIFLGILLFVFVLIFSPFISDFYDVKELETLINTVALTFLIKPWGQQFMILLQKEMEFLAISVTEICSRIISMLVTITLAWNGFGVYSLAVGTLTYSIFTTIGFIINGRKRYIPKFHFSLKDIREFLNFGLYQMGDKCLTYFAMQLDTIIIGKVFGTEILGFYNVAKELTSKPYSVINPVITKVTFPLMSLIKDNLNDLKKVYLKTIEYLSLINIPIYLLISVLAKPIVLLLFGEKWLEAVPLVQVLAISYIFRSIGNPAGSLLLSKGKAKTAFFWNLIIFSVSPLYLLIGSKFGILGVTFSVLLLQISLFYPNWKFIVNKVVALPLNEYSRAIFRPALFATISISFVYPITLILGASITQITVGFFVFSAAYIFILFMKSQYFIIEIISFLPENIAMRIFRYSLFKKRKLQKENNI